MASKRTNDSVDSILSELHRAQTAASVRSGVNDQQVDDILSSLGISAGSGVTPPVTGPGSVDLDDILADLPSLLSDPRPVAPQPAPAPAPRPAAPQPAPSPAPRAAEPRPEPQPAPQDGNTGDTTRTGIIKNFLLKMAPEGADADADALNAGKNQFQKFFGESVAVVPDEKGRLRDPGKKKRGFLGLVKVEETEEFVPINVSLTGTDTPREPVVPEQEPQPARPAPKKRGGLFGLFGAEPAGEDDLLEEETTPPPPQPESTEPDGAAVYRSKYTADRRAKAEPVADPAPFTDPGQGVPLSSSTMELLRSALNTAKTTDGRTSSGSTVYRKKRDTVEFTPGQKKTAPPQPAAPAPGPVGEPLPERPAAVNTYTSTGFTVQMDPLDPFSSRPLDSTREFLEAFNAVYPRAGAHTPSAPPTPEPTPEPTPAARPRAATGQIDLEPVAPAPRAPAAAAPARPAQDKPRLASSDFVNNIAQSLNEQPTGQISLDVNDGAAAPLLGTIDLTDGADGTAARLKKAAERIRLTGQPADEAADAATPPFTEELPRIKGGPRYDSVDDVPRVRRALEQQSFYQTVAALVTGALALVLLYLGTAAAGKGLPMPAALDPAAGSAPLLGVCLVLLMAGGALHGRTLWNGLRGLVSEPSPDSMPTLAVLAALVQLVVLLAVPAAYRTSLSIMAGPALLLLAGNGAGKAMDAASLRDSFRLVSAKVDHSVAYRLRDSGIQRAITGGLAEPRPTVLVSRPTQLFKNFLPAAGAHRTSDKNQQQFAWALGFCALLSLVVVLIKDRDAGKAVSAMAAVLALGTPLAGTLLSALPARLMQRSAAQVGAVVPGWKDIRQLGRINVIRVTARDLFPAGCVTLCGINPVHKERIDLAIVYAASVLSGESTILRDIFLGMIGN
ncbi:MAG: hypothetical protein ACI4OI_04290, partial [Gemmiger sp.]